MNIKQALIKVINPVRSGVSISTGREWRSQDLVISWPRQMQDGSTREQLLSVTLHGESIDRLATMHPVAGQTLIDGALDFQTRTYNGKVYNEITLYI